MARITGINSGLDIDALVKASMTTYQSKIDKEAQNKKVLEYQQEQYKKIISDAANFYDKYFDILKTGNLMSTNTYQSVSFKSGDDTKVTAKGFAGADISNYGVTVTQLASKATASFKSTDLLKGGKLEIKVDGKEPISIEIKDTIDKEADMQIAVNTLKEKLNAAGIDVSAKYSEFSDSIILESGKMGENISFKAGLGSSETYEEYKGTNAKGIITKGKESYNIDQASNALTVDNVQFTLKGVTKSTKEETASALVDADKASSTVTTTTTKTLTQTVDGIRKTTTIITSSDGITTTTTTDGTTTTKTTQATEATGEVKTKTTTSKTVDGVITTTTIENGIITTIKIDGTTTTTTTINADKTTTTEIIKDGNEITGTKADAIGALISQIHLGDGEGVTSTTTMTITDLTTGAISVTKDGNTTNYTSISLSGSTDVTALKEKIVSFVNDYNTLLSSINTKIYETRDKDYMPLSDEQKKEMTDDQIEKWEAKAQTGLIRKDMDLERITSAMKTAMSTVISGSGLTLESIGIKPVANYAEKNGMFTIDEATLTKALEENAGNIKDLFTRAASENDKGGIFTQLAATLKSEFKSSTASLSKKAGIDGTSTQYSNTLTKSIAKKKTLIQELNDKFSVKETALYKKYSALETALEKLNSQQASLSSMLGTS